MNNSIRIGNREYSIGGPFDISIPLNFNGKQPNAYGVQPATSKACGAGDLVGDTRRGGSCNFETYTFIPHCNGTHTECVGHITNERISVRECLQDVFIPAVLVSIQPERPTETTESYAVEFVDNDLLITRRALEAAIAQGTEMTALIVRTLPNDDSKFSREYVEVIPPFFSTDAMQFIAENFKHLLVDLPSIDRIFDDGKLSNHRIFWNVEQGSFQTNDRTRVQSTITELIYVPNEIAVGNYLLNLQIAPFASDASPSRPILFPIHETAD